MIQQGWAVAEDISDSSDVTTLTASATTTLLTKTIPGGAKAHIKSLNCRVIDAGSDLITFEVRRNGMAVAHGLAAIPGSQFDYTATLPIDRTVEPGDITVVGINSGGVDIRAVCTLGMDLLRSVMPYADRGRY